MNKVRVWHKELGRFVTSDEWFLNLEGELCFYDFEDLVLVDKALYVVQRFTGLFDKNKKEIYEGDLVKLHHTWETKTPHVSEVKINFDGCAIIEPHPKHTNGNSRALQNFTHFYCAEQGFATCEIVGNIFESCPQCGGIGGLDSGGMTPWGSPIFIPCPSCQKI